jgi:hypothetical protein
MVGAETGNGIQIAGNFVGFEIVPGIPPSFAGDKVYAEADPVQVVIRRELA